MSWPTVTTRVDNLVPLSVNVERRKMPAVAVTIALAGGILMHDRALDGRFAQPARIHDLPPIPLPAV